jgi:Arc/MetJ-type ribon-helix-helix transcriptional regulator
MACTQRKPVYTIAQTQLGVIMNLSPQVRDYIDAQVKAGRFPTPEAVIESAILEIKDAEEPELDDETVAAIEEGLSQADRGEGMELSEFRAKMERRIASR